MNEHLTPELEQIVQNRVNSGRYNSADCDELIDRRQRDLRKKITQGLDSLQRGEGVDGEEFFGRLEREEAALESNLRTA